MACDSEDESHCNRALSHAVKKKKTQQKTSPKTKASATYSYTDSFNQCLWSGMDSTSCKFLALLKSLSVGPQTGFFHEKIQSQQMNVVPSAFGPCFDCGEPYHIHRTCPYTKIAVQEQPDTLIKQGGIVLISKMSTFLSVMILIVTNLLKIILSMNRVKKI